MAGTVSRVLIEDASVRGQERSRLEAAVARLGEGGGPGVVQLVGQAGIGKSFLLGWLVDAARERGFWIGVGRARELDGGPSFGVFAEGLEVLCSDREFTGVWRRLDADTRTALGPIAPVLAGEQAAAGVGAYRVRRAMRLLLGALAARRPLLLALDDLHCADEESLLLLAYLLDHLPAAPVLVAVGYRSPGLLARVAAALGTRPETIELGPLSREDARGVLPGVFDERAVGRLWAQSGGVPLYLRELARTAGHADMRAAQQVAERGAGVPRVVVASVAEQLSELGEREDGDAAVRLLGAGSVLGQFCVRAAGEVAGLAEQETLAALSVLIEGGLRLREPGGRFEFCHPMVRRAVSVRPGQTGAQPAEPEPRLQTQPVRV